MICPYCKEKIKNGAEKCKHCQGDFTTDEGKKKLKEANKTSTSTWILTAIIGFIIISAIVGSQGQNNNTSTTTATPRNGFETDCLSAWDGSFKGFNDSFKKKLKDPGSFEHIETKYSGNTDGTYTLLVSYRAKNGFGAKDIGAVTFKADKSCNIVGNVTQLQ